MASIVSLVKRYSVPLLLFFLSIFFQLYVIPSAFPPSHYDVLGVKRFASVEQVTEAYQKLSSKWNSVVEIPMTVDFLKIRYAFELLTNPLWKRDYDLYGIEEQLNVLEKVKGQYIGESFSKIDLPLLDAASSDFEFNVLSTEDFLSTIGNTRAWLIQVYSSGSTYCAQFSISWKRIASLLDGVAGSGMVELGDVQLATYLAEKKSTGQPFFRNGLPSLVAFPQGCRKSDCLVRYQGDLLVDAVVDWFATIILGLPRIAYYSKESLGQNFIMKSGQHKVKVICFSKTGERAAPFFRQAAKDYWAYASFAFVLWREEESSIWWKMFEVESAPAIVFLKDPGVKPVVHHGTLNSSQFFNMMEHNKNQDLPQLRSVNSLELGCDARGYSRTGNDTLTWYCVILAGRRSLELNKMRETMRRVNDILSSDVGSNIADKDSISTPAAEALKRKHMTFAWLDGEAQKKYCFFYIHSENSYETCGPRSYGDLNDVPRLFIVRYKRNSTYDVVKVEKKPKTIWDTFQEDESNLASQLVASYNGSMDITEIIQWISQIVKDGESRDLPFYRIKTPELIPEDGDPIWSKGAKSLLVTSKGMKQRIQSITTKMFDYMGDPRIGPIMLLGSLISFGGVWLQQSQSTQSTQPSHKMKDRAARRNRNATTRDQDRPSSITDDEPKDASQLLSTDSDTE